jgi:hypothetical protein
MLVVTGTDDNAYQPHANSLIIAGKIPEAWLIQIEDAGHAVMSQYPVEINRILHTFLSTPTQPNQCNYHWSTNGMSLSTISQEVTNYK